MGGKGKAGFRGGPRPVRRVTAPGGMGDCDRSDGRLRPVAGVTAPGHMGGPGLEGMRRSTMRKRLILLERSFWENFSGAKNIVMLYFGGSGDWIILRLRVIAPSVARTVLFCAGDGWLVSGLVRREFCLTNKSGRGIQLQDQLMPGLALGWKGAEDEGT